MYFFFAFANIAQQPRRRKNCPCHFERMPRHYRVWVCCVLTMNIIFFLGPYAVPSSTVTERNFAIFSRVSKIFTNSSLLQHLSEVSINQQPASNTHEALSSNAQFASSLATETPIASNVEQEQSHEHSSSLSPINGDHPAISPTATSVLSTPGTQCSSIEEPRQDQLHPLQLCNFHRNTEYTKGAWAKASNIENCREANPTMLAYGKEKLWSTWETKKRTCWNVSEAFSKVKYEAMMHVWQPHNCGLMPLDSNTIQAMYNVSILMIGDSLTGQLRSSLYGLIGGHKPAAFSRANVLVSTTTWNIENSSVPWVVDLKSMDPDFLVFNTGQHWQRYDKSFDYYPIMVGNVLKHIARTFSGQIVFVGSFAGHANCDNATSPWKYFVEPESDKWSWEKPKTVEHYWTFYANRYGIMNRFFLLNTSMLSLRPDAHTHRDCLHYCSPGALDWIARLLVHYIVETVQMLHTVD
jgi:hypothetical protein